MHPNPSAANDTKIKLVLIWLGKLGVALVILLAFLFRGNLRPVGAPGAERPASPPIITPTTTCRDAALFLGSDTFPIKIIQPALDGSLAIPADTAGIAYWVKGTDPNFVFLLSPMPKNMTTMSTLTVGSTAKLLWSDCSFKTYRLSAPQQGSLDGSISPDLSTAGITIFFESDVSQVGFVFRGARIDE